MADRPIVTVAIPLYNSARYIAATIDSVLAQSLTNIELIIYDDSSRDGSLQIARSYESRDSRVRVVASESNVGPEANWNRCLSAVRGKYFKLLCGDDLLDPECLARQVAVFEDPGNADVSLVSCARWIIDSRGKKLFRRRSRNATRKVSGRELVDMVTRCGTNPIGEPGCGLIRTEIIPSVGLYSARFPYVIDLDYWVRVARHGAWVAMPECLFSFRVSGSSWSARLGWAQASQFLAFADALASTEGLVLSPWARVRGTTVVYIQSLLRALVFKMTSR